MKLKVAKLAPRRERDEDRARVIVLEQALADLLEWEQHTGGWEAPCWDRARRLVAQNRRLARKVGA